MKSRGKRVPKQIRGRSPPSFFPPKGGKTPRGRIGPKPPRLTIFPRGPRGRTPPIFQAPGKRGAEKSAAPRGPPRGPAPKNAGHEGPFFLATLKNPPPPRERTRGPFFPFPKPSNGGAPPTRFRDVTWGRGSLSQSPPGPYTPPSPPLFPPSSRHADIIPAAGGQRRQNPLFF